MEKPTARCQDKKCKGYGKPLVDKGYGYPVCETTPQKGIDATLQLRKWKHQRCQETPRKGSACITPDGNKYASDVNPEINCLSCRYNWVKLERQSIHPSRKGDSTLENICRKMNITETQAELLVARKYNIESLIEDGFVFDNEQSSDLIEQINNFGEAKFCHDRDV